MKSTSLLILGDKFALAVITLIGFANYNELFLIPLV
jgi:hypothetical protein